MAYVDPRILAGMSQAATSKYNLMRALSPGIQAVGNMANFGANQTALRPGEENPLGSPDFGDDFIRGINARRNPAVSANPAVGGAPPTAVAAASGTQPAAPTSLVADTYGIARGQTADPLADAHAVLRDFKKIGAGYGDLPTTQDVGSAGAYGGRTDKRAPGWYSATDGWADGTPIDENNQWMTGIVQGPGGPKDDKVGPAMLSDGEAVVPAKTVNYLNDAMGDPNGMAKLIYGTDTAPKNPDVRAEQVAKVGGADAVKAFMAKQAGQPSVVRGKVVQKFADGNVGGYSAFDNRIRMNAVAEEEAANRAAAQAAYNNRAPLREAAAAAEAAKVQRAVDSAKATTVALEGAQPAVAEASAGANLRGLVSKVPPSVARLAKFGGVAAPLVGGGFNVLRDHSNAAKLAHGLAGLAGAGMVYTSPMLFSGPGAAAPIALGGTSYFLDKWGDSLESDYMQEHPELQDTPAAQKTMPTPTPAAAPQPRSPLSDLGITRQTGGGTPSFTYDAQADTTPAAVPGQAAVNAYTQALQARDARIQKLGAKSAALGDSGDVFNAEPTHIATLRELATIQSGGDSLDGALGGVGGVGGASGASGKSRTQQWLDFAKGVQDMKVSQATAEENKAKLRNEENKYVVASLTDAEKPLAAKYASVMAGNTTAEAKIQALRDLAALEKAGILTDPDAPHTLNDREMLLAIQQANQAQGNSNISGEGPTSFMPWGKRARQQGAFWDKFRAAVSPFDENIPLTVGNRNAGTLVRPLDRESNDALMRLLSATSK